ncbi:hypothetical protein FQV11_0007816, partial [Eudyptes moseleyi]
PSPQQHLPGFAPQGDDGDEDFNLTQTPTHSQVQRNLERRSQDQVNQKVSELVQFLLVKDQKKIPIKRADILKKVIREYKDVYSEIVNRAGRTLQQQPRRQPRPGCLYRTAEQKPPAAAQARRLEGSVGGLGSAGHLLPSPGVPQNVLRGGGVGFTTHPPPLPCRYLEITPIPLTDPPEFKYQWGPRAAKETSKRDVLRFVAKIQGKDPMFWTSQYKEAEAAP